MTNKTGTPPYHIHPSIPSWPDTALHLATLDLTWACLDGFTLLFRCPVCHGLLLTLGGGGGGAKHTRPALVPFLLPFPGSHSQHSHTQTRAHAHTSYLVYLTTLARPNHPPRPRSPPPWSTTGLDEEEEKRKGPKKKKNLSSFNPSQSPRRLPCSTSPLFNPHSSLATASPSQSAIITATTTTTYRAHTRIPSVAFVAFALTLHTAHRTTHNTQHTTRITTTSTRHLHSQPSRLTFAHDVVRRHVRGDAVSANRHLDPDNGHARLVRRRLRQAQRHRARLDPRPLHRLRPRPRLGHLHPLQLPPQQRKRPLRRRSRPRLRRRLHRRRLVPARHQPRRLHQPRPRRPLVRQLPRPHHHLRPALQLLHQQALRHAQGLVGLWHHQHHPLLLHRRPRLAARRPPLLELRAQVLPPRPSSPSPQPQPRPS